MSEDATVFIIDDDRATRETLASFVGTMGLKAEPHESAEALLATYDGKRAGCALIDLRLPGMNGLDLMDELSARQAPLGVVMITAHGEVPAAVRAMKAGAVDFLQKPCPPAELRDSIRRALDLGAAQVQATGEPTPNTLFENLTDSERQVLDLTIAGVPNKSIVSQLGISLRTVHMRRASLMRKFGATNRSQLIRLALRSMSGGSATAAGPA
ncbi:MAG TPA: response regulator [Pirellulales bacterium]|nr:response regulator [Pirellulales bacterium]